MTRRYGLPLVLLFVAGAVAAAAQPRVEVPSTSPQQFRLFLAPPALQASAPLAGVGAVKTESLVRLPGDPDSVFSLGGPGRSGEPQFRLAIEVNEATLKLLTPDPKVEASDTRPRSGGDWKPIDSAGRPYQLRFGARIIW
ncbi:MAG TPA: hypothetical protein VE129_08440 [Thermoanaerobaculia bacterium]|nr:hypothetical protein [Thermoanaerobaculia bacterium]